MVENEIKVGIEYLRLAEKDILASRIMQDNQIYSLSVFHLEQSFEKMVKAVCLIVPIDEDGNSPLTLDEIKKEHSPAKLLVNATDKVFIKMENNPYLKSISNIFRQQVETLKKELSNINGRNPNEEISQCLAVTKVNISDYLNKDKMDKSAIFFNKYFFRLGLIGALLFPHYELTRYPFNQKNEYISLEEYQNKEIGITNYLKEIIEIGQAILEDINKEIK